jgi:hypothetical protein
MMHLKIYTICNLYFIILTSQFLILSPSIHCAWVKFPAFSTLFVSLIIIKMLLFNGHIHLSELVDCCSTLRHDVVVIGVTNETAADAGSKFPQ